MKENEIETTRKEIKEQLSLYIDVDSLISGTLAQVAANVLAIETRLREEHRMIKLNPEMYLRFEIAFGMTYSYGDSSPELEIYGIRMENDKEFTARLLRNKNARAASKLAVKKAKETAEKKDLANWIRLQAKFGNKPGSTQK